MEILHSCPSSSFSGLEQYAFELAFDQKKRGLKVGFIVAPGSRLEAECLKNDIVTVLYNPDKMGGGSAYLRSFLKSPGSFGDLKVLHLHSTQEVAHVAPLIYLRKLRRQKLPKVILQIHIWINHQKNDPLHRFLYSIVDELWCSSLPAKGALSKSLPIPPAKFKIINYGRHVEALENGFLNQKDARKILGLPQDSTIFGTVARLEKSKGIKEFLVAGLPLLSGDRPIDLAIIGSASPNNDDAILYEKELLGWKNQQSAAVQSHIHFLGAWPDSFKYLKAFDVYALPSYEECFSLSLLDAQAAGLPVLGSQTGGTPEVVVETVTGWLFDPQNSESLGNAMAKAMGEKKDWKTYGQMGKTRILRDFDQKLIFEQVLKEYGLPNE